MKKRVFISGITGVMGQAGLAHLLKYKDQIEIVSLVKESRKDRKIMELYKKLNKDSNIEIIWGDLRNYKDVKRALKDVDYILHVAALVSPEADYKPEEAWEINVGSIENILKAIHDLGIEDVKLIYIGSVAQTGCRLPPLHWARVGDPLKPSIYDHYAVTKIAGERKVIESGLKYWVSLRQTGILHDGLIETRDGIIFHQPLNNVLEWITEDDSGRLLANICIKELPEAFWQNIYNVGGGESCRKTNYEFTSMLLETLGVKDIKKIFEPYWFANRNFHGQYYLDSHILNDYLDFRRESMEDFVRRLKKKIGFPTVLLKYMPSFVIKDFIMKPIVDSKYGTQKWIKSKDMDKINAYFGSLDQCSLVRTWDDLNLAQDYGKVVVLDHGYDETKDLALLDIEDMKGAAKFRGGKCLSETMIKGDLDTKLKWECGFLHEFMASPRLILKGGHWCETCEASPWNYDEIAKKNPFFAQVWEG